MKLTKITLQVSIVSTAILFILSLITEFFLCDNKVNNFIVSWMMGVACSLVVVIITTYLQFKQQERDVTFELGTKILVLLHNKKRFDETFDDSILDSELTKIGAEIDVSKYINNQIETLNECIELLGKHETFSKAKSDATDRLFSNIGIIIESFAFTTIKDDQYKILCDLDQKGIFTKIAIDTLVITEKICGDFINTKLVDHIVFYQTKEEEVASCD